MSSYIDQMYGVYSGEQALYHHGILGQKWGVRRYQNPDGSLTAAGKKRAAKEAYRSEKKSIRDKRRKAEEDWEDRATNEFLEGRYSNQESARRGQNQETLRYYNSRSSRLAAKAKMNREIAENSSGLAKNFRQMKADMETRGSEKASRAAAQTSKMIDITNDVYEKRLGVGEKIATELLTTPTFRNQYYSNRAKMSAGEAYGRIVVDNILRSVAASV